jgi:hypothetical protein
MKFLYYLSIFFVTGCALEFAAVASPSSVSIVELDKSAWAGSSVNVLAGVRQALFSDGEYQYAGYYNVEGKLVLAKRHIGERAWVKHVTEYSGNVVDAHNHISLVVDGAGYLHVSWDHHNTPLKYARALQPGSLELGAPGAMLGQDEKAVTYPQFYRLPSGDVLFQYRDGGSGNGRLVMNRYFTAQKKWQRVHDSLIDGEGKRSAYWDMALDSQGVLHLVWNWRETPDVASNHDLAYARSYDGGKTWKQLNGTIYALPITLASADYALRIPQNSNLMNPPSVAADDRSRPFITSYWSPAAGKKPRYHVVYPDAETWRVIVGPESTESFTLSGMGTKRPLISRAVILVESNAQQTSLQLIYRDERQAGRVIAASLTGFDNLAKAENNNARWQQDFLTQQTVGAWEPSIDPEQWLRHGQVHMLLQNVDQLDGNDSDGAKNLSSSLGVLQWSKLPANKD